MEFVLTQPLYLTGIYYWRASVTDPLPATVAIFNVATQTIVPGTQVSVTDPGTAGWIKISPTSQILLAAATNYKVAVQGGGVAAWYSATSHYWDTGAGAAGITNGPLTAYNNAGADVGQDSFAVGSLAYPTGTFNATNYWVDVEVSTSAPLFNTATLTGAGALTAVPTLLGAATLTGVGAVPTVHPYGFNLVYTDTAAFADGAAGHVYTFPEGAPSAGDLDVLCVNSSTTVSTPTSAGAPWVLGASHVGSQGAYLWYRFATGGESNTTTITTAGNFPAQASLSRWRAQNPLADVAVSAFVESPAGTTTPAVSTGPLNGLDELVIAFAALGVLHTRRAEHPRLVGWLHRPHIRRHRHDQLRRGGVRRLQQQRRSRV